MHSLEKVNFALVFLNDRHNYLRILTSFYANNNSTLPEMNEMPQNRARNSPAMD